MMEQLLCRGLETLAVHTGDNPGVVELQHGARQSLIRRAGIIGLGHIGDRGVLVDGRQVRGNGPDHGRQVFPKSGLLRCSGFIHQVLGGKKVIQTVFRNQQIIQSREVPRVQHALFLPGIPLRDGKGVIPHQMFAEVPGVLQVKGVYDGFLR